MSSAVTGNRHSTAGVDRDLDQAAPRRAGPPVHAPPRRDQLEQIRLAAHRLRRPEHQETIRIQREVEQRDDLLLDFGLEINQQVAATDQVQLGERSVADQVLRGENDRFTQPFVDLVAVIVGLGEKPPQPLGRQVAGDVSG